MDRPLATAAAVFVAVKVAGALVNLPSFPVLRTGSAPARPPVSILVPARDEAVRLASSLPGFLAQPAEEILVLDDGSTDGTADVVAAAAVGDQRLRLLRGASLPPGWVGKAWACHQLAAAARGQLLVFCDADVDLAPGALDAVVAQAETQAADVFSVFPRQRTGSVGERLLVPLIDDVLLTLLPFALLDLPVAPAAAANGQLLVFTRAAYAGLGGHAAVGGSLVEDVALGRLARRQGYKLGLALGGELVGARMYEGYGQSVRGFAKSLRAAHGGSRLLLGVTAACHVVAYTAPWWAWGRHRWWRVAAVGGLVERVLVNAKTGRRSFGEAALVPITPLAALPVYALALRGRAVWKGRVYR